MFGDISNFSSGVNTAFLVILGISILFLIALTVTMLVFVFKYSRKKNPKATTTLKHSTKLEILWTVIPTLLVLLMFYFGWSGYTPMREVPKDAMVVESVGRMWTWDFNYPNGKSSKVLYVPLNKAVKLDLKSVDVLHSLYIPAFSVKEDVVPGKENFLWFEAKREGTYDLFCTEYCGLEHSSMITKVEVVSQAKFDEWLATKETYNTNEPIGLQVIKKNACTACHSFDGTKLVGPSFKGLMGRKEMVETAGEKREITVDSDYIKKSITDPNADIVEGFNKGLMQSYKESISDEELNEIVKYLETLK